MDLYGEFKKNVNFENRKFLVSLIGTDMFFANNYNINLFDFRFDVSNMLNSEKKAFYDFKSVFFIPGVWPNYGSAIVLASMLGARISWPNNNTPMIRGAVLDELKEINKLKMPDCRQDGFGPWFLNALKKFMEDKSFKDNLHFAWSIGPGELAGFVLGLSDFLISTIEDPDNTKKLLSFCTDMIIDFLEKQFEINKEAEGFLLTDDISGLLCKESYEELLLPFHLKIRNAFNDKILVFHNDTQSNHIVESLIKSRIDVFNFGPTTDIDLLIKKMLKPKKVALMGNIDPCNVLAGKDKDLIRIETRKVLGKVMGYPGFMISAGGGLNATPSENINILLGEVERHNKRIHTGKSCLKN